MMIVKYSASDVPSDWIRLYQLKNKSWYIVGYKCPDCLKHYQTLHAELFRHHETCRGKPVNKRSLED
jgi:hypothetical protein